MSLLRRGTKKMKSILEFDIMPDLPIYKDFEVKYKGKKVKFQYLRVFIEIDIGENLVME